MTKALHLEKLDLDQLKTLAGDVQKAIATAERVQVKKARAAAEQAVKKYGLTLAYVMNGSRKPRSNGTSLLPKYRNPDNVEQTWSGRGRQPAWFKSALGKGVSPEDLAIKRRSPPSRRAT